MARSDLISGSMWMEYSQKVSERMNAPRFRGEILEEEAKELGAKLVVADWGAESCGDAVRLYWAVDPKTDTIKKAAFKSFGCGTAIASSDVMAELTIGRTVDEALKITNLEVEKALRDEEETPAVPPQKMHCSVMAYDVIKKAVSIYKNVDVEQLEEKEIICECARVTLASVKDVIRLNDIKTVEEITDYTKAGAFCKSCVKEGGHEKRDHYLSTVLAETRDEMEKEQVKAAASVDQDFVSMNTVGKFKVIESVLEEKIRPMLKLDGGNLEVVDIKEIDASRVDVCIEYLGACKGCPSAKTSTFDVIERELKSSVFEGIFVVVL